MATVWMIIKLVFWFHVGLFVLLEADRFGQWLGKKTKEWPDKKLV